MDHRRGRRPPYEEAYALAAWAAAHRSYSRGQIARLTGGGDPELLPATVLFDLFYCLVLDETQEAVERREELDAVLATAVASRATPDGKPDRASWGLLPHQQRAMRAARDAGGTQARADRTPRVAGRR